MRLYSALLFLALAITAYGAPTPTPRTSSTPTPTPRASSTSTPTPRTSSTPTPTPRASSSPTPTPASSTPTPASSAPIPKRTAPADGNLPGLGSTQTIYARAIIAQNAAENLGRQGCLAAITTGMTESGLLIFANSKVPASFNYPHDAIGDNYDSVGIFQQRVEFYPDIAADMDPAQSASQFFAHMVTISGWQTMDVATLCQDVQRSEIPTAYRKYVGQAEKICSAAGF